MIGPDLSRVAVYVRPGVTDMRKAINGLSNHKKRHRLRDAPNPCSKELSRCPREDLNLHVRKDTRP